MPATPANRPFPSWRKIESVLIELLREEGFELSQYNGDTFVELVHSDDEMTVAEINLGDFARQLEERL